MYLHVIQQINILYFYFTYSLYNEQTNKILLKLTVMIGLLQINSTGQLFPQHSFSVRVPNVSFGHRLLRSSLTGILTWIKKYIEELNFSGHQLLTYTTNLCTELNLNEFEIEWSCSFKYLHEIYTSRICDKLYLAKWYLANQRKL